MDRDTLNRFKALFESKRERLLYSGRLVNEDFQLRQEDLADETDMTSTENETGMRMRLRNREALYLKKIDEALAKIAAGTFGMCEDCTTPIGLRRLEVRPTANLCLECKESQEQSERVHIDGHRFKSLGAKMKFI